MAFLVSGRGSNFKAILEHIELGVLQEVEPEIMITDNPNANAINVAEKNDVDYKTIEFKEESEKFEKKTSEVLAERNVDLVILAGFMRILGSHLIDKYREKIMNIHPALLPSFKGLNAQKQALEFGVKVTGCTIHYASEDVDSGPIIIQHPVPVKKGDTIKSLSKRILIFEHRLYSKAIQLHVDGRLEIEKGKVKINYEENWEEKWKERQKKFIKHQKKNWKKDKFFEESWNDYKV